MIYLAVFPIIYLCEIVGAFCREKYSNSKKASYILTFFPFFIMFLLIALRGPDTGPDSQSYLSIAEELGNLSFADLTNPSFNRIIREPGFEFITKALYVLTHSPQSLLIFMAAVTCLCYWILINELSPDPYLSVLVFYCASFFMFSLNIARQVMSAALCGIFYLLLIRRKYVPALLISILGTLFHSSAPIGFILIFLVTLLPIRKFMAALFSAVAVLSVLFVRPIMELVFSVITKYQIYLNVDKHDSVGMVIILWGIELAIAMYLLYFAVDNHPEKSLNATHTLNRMDRHIYCSILFTVMYVAITFCSSFVWLALRIGFYFEIGVLFLFSMFTERIREHQSRLIYLLTIVLINVLFTFWMSRSSADPLYTYHFFFEYG